jgi:hypothetical protein
MEAISDKKIAERLWILWNLQLCNLFRYMTGATF